MNINIKWSKYVVMASITGLVALASYASVSRTSAQSSMTGEWIMETKSGSDFVYFSIHRRSDRGGNYQSSSDIKIDSDISADRFAYTPPAGAKVEDMTKVPGMAGDKEAPKSAEKTGAAKDKDKD